MPNREPEASHVPDPRRHASRHLPPSGALREPDRHARRGVRRSDRGVQRGAVPLSPRQRPDPADPLGRRRPDLVGARDRVALVGQDRQLGLRLLRTRRRDLAGQPDDHRPFQARYPARRASWAAQPNTQEWGDWTWAYKLQSWLGTFVVKSSDRGRTWSEPIPVNVRPLKHGGCRLGCWQLPRAAL